MKLEISENIRRKRREREMSQEQLAEVLGVSPQTVSHLERGDTYPDMEMLPVLAGFFSMTTDELLGVSGALSEERFKKYVDEANAAMHGSEERIAILRRAHAEMPNNWHLALLLCSELSLNHDYLDEMRAVVYDAMERCHDPLFRDNMLELLCESEDEDKVEDFIKRYASIVDTRRGTLLEHRYKTRGEWEKFAVFNQKNLIYKMKQLFSHTGDRRAEIPDPARSLARVKANFAFLNTLLDIDEEVCRLNPVSADGVPDMWSSSRIYYGYRMAHALSGAGRYDEALYVLEDAVSLFESLYSLPDGSILSYRLDSRGLFDTVVSSHFEDNVRILGHDYGSLKWVEFMYETLAESKPQIEGCTAKADLEILLGRSGWEWFDPIRSHPRYLACVERIIKAASGQDGHESGGAFDENADIVTDDGALANPVRFVKHDADKNIIAI